MMRRFTSSPKPAPRVAAMTRSAVTGPSSGSTRRPKRMPSNFARLLDASDGMIR